MLRHRIQFQYSGTDDDHAIQLAFSKKMVDMRKEWLTNGMEERKRRRELGLPEIYLYGKETKKVSYNDFVNKELILFSNMDNERSIPSLVDGLKPGQRKIIFTCFKRNDKREVKVAQLAGSVAEHSAYHHGEMSLNATIINLAQNFVGSNNINLLLPIGQFGTRLQGGKDAASPRYIFTMLNPVTKTLFPNTDFPLLNYLYDDNLKIEPEYYVPVVPMVLVNGAEGIGTGWSTKIPNYNPRDLVKNIYRMLDGQEPFEMIPWFKNFRGTIERIDAHHYIVSGEVALLEDNKIEITELPIRSWTQNYKESVLEPMLHGTDKEKSDKDKDKDKSDKSDKSQIIDYKEYHTDTTVRFVVTMTPEKLREARNIGLHKVFKLQTSISTTSMVLFDSLGCIKKYDSCEQILKEFYEIRFALYERRKEYLVGILDAEALKLKNQARFIIEKIENKITIENRKKLEMIATLQDRGYDSDPVKAWKESQKNIDKDNKEESDSEEETSKSGPDYDYLLGMTLWSLTREKKEELLRKRDEKIKELEDLKSKTPSDLWRADLETFIKELDEFERKEREDMLDQPKKIKLTGKKKKVEEDTKPSAFGERIEPRIDDEIKKKFEKKPAVPGEPKKRKKKDPIEKKVDDEDAKEASFAERVGGAKEKKEKKKGLKQTTLNFKGTKKSPKKGRNPWSDSEEEKSDFSDMDIEETPPAEKQKVVPRRAAANKAKYKFDSDEDPMKSSDSEDYVQSSAKKEDSDVDSPPQTKATENKTEEQNGDPSALSDSEDDYTPAPATNDKPSGDLFDSLLGSESPVKTAQKRAKGTSSDSDSSMKIESVKPKPAPKKRAKKKNASSDDDFDVKPVKESAPKEKKPRKKADGPKKPRAPAKTKKSKKSESDDEFNGSLDEDVISSQPAREPRGGRTKAPKSYNFGDSSSDDDF